MTALLRREGWAVNGKRVRRLRAALAILGRPPVRRTRTTDRNHDFPRFPNLVEDLEVVRLDQVWVADIPYVRLHLFFSSRRRHTRCLSDWSSDVCSSDLLPQPPWGVLQADWPEARRAVLRLASLDELPGRLRELEAARAGSG